MPLQFVCSNCHRRLSVGSRKAGCAVACPKCGQENIVPQRAAASDSASSSVAAEVPTVPPVATADVKPQPFDFNGFDDVLDLIEDQPRGALPLPATVADAKPLVAAPPPIDVGAADRGSVTIVTGPPPIPPAVVAVVADVGIRPSPVRSTIARRGPKQPSSFPPRVRKALNARNGVVAGLVAVAFITGLFVGRIGQPKASGPRPEPRGEPVPLEGRVLYSLSPGHSLADERAVVIALPGGKTPEKKIDVRGIRPNDEDDLDAVPSADALRALGGAAVRTDGQGEFVLVLPRPGNYWVLIISRHAGRPEELGIGTSDAKELGGYFTSPGELIGQQRYSLSSRRLAGAPPKLVHEFGPTDKQ